MPSRSSSSSTLVPGWLAGTFAGGLLVHCCFIPLWVGCIVPPFLAVYLLFCGGLRMLAGLALIGLIVYLDFGITVRWRPWFMRLIYELNMTRYYSRCELRGALDAVKTERNLFMFHPHGILSVGFVCNGVWNRAFNDLASPPAQQKAILAARMGDPPGAPWRGTAFMIAQNLREWSGFFKVLCDVSGRLESATRQNLTRRMAEGRNVGIIPGGFEDATLHVQGRERTAMSDRKGLIKYALQHGYALTPIYTFGESETYATFPYLLKPRLWRRASTSPLPPARPRVRGLRRASLLS